MPQVTARARRCTALHHKEQDDAKRAEPAMNNLDRLSAFADSIKGAIFNVLKNGGDELAMAMATVEHISGCLGSEIEENEKLRAINAEMLSALKSIVAANDEFRASLPSDFEGDPL